MNKYLFESSVDMSEVGQINYDWDFDEDDYKEYLEDSELEDNRQNLIEYIKDNVTFGIEYLDNIGYHNMGYDDVSYDDLEYDYGTRWADEILNDCMTKGGGSIETTYIFNDNIDINDPQSLDDAAMKLLPHGDYQKDCRGFILSNGETVYTPMEHNACTTIDGVKGTSHFIDLGNIRVLQNSIDIGRMPTSSQLDVLRKVVASYDGQQLYVDFSGGKQGNIGVTYNSPTFQKLYGDIRRYYNDGMKPMGDNNNLYENFEWLVRRLVNENRYDAEFNKAVSEFEQFKKEKDAEYGTPYWDAFGWMKRNHPEIQVKQEDIDRYQELESLKDDISQKWNEEEDKEEAIKRSQTQEYFKEQETLINLATQEFGLTDRLSQAGYILPDGSLLNFGEDGDRGTDHRAIEGIYKRNGINIWDDRYRYNYVVDFLNHGAVRIDANCGSIDMTKEPTPQEYSVIKNIVRNNGGEVCIDFTNSKGNTAWSVSYDSANPNRVIADIQKYYNDGIRPQGDNNDLYENKKTHKIMRNRIRLSEGQLRRVIKESVCRILNEIGDTQKGQYALGKLQGRYTEQGKGWKPSWIASERRDDAAEEAYNKRKQSGFSGAETSYNRKYDTLRDAYRNGRDDYDR